MKRIYIKAFNKLIKMGVPVYEHHDDNGNFSISAEDEGSSNWVNYHDGARIWGDSIKPELRDTLIAMGLFAEWHNPGRLAVYQI